MARRIAGSPAFGGEKATSGSSEPQKNQQGDSSHQPGYVHKIADDAGNVQLDCSASSLVVFAFQFATLYSQALRHASQYIKPSVHRRTSSWDWQYTQYLSHKQLSSGRSQLAQTMRLKPGLEDMVRV